MTRLLSFYQSDTTLDLSELKSFVRKEIIKGLNSLPNDKILDKSKINAFADDKIIMTRKLKLAIGREENIVEKGENAGYQHFAIFPQYL